MNLITGIGIILIILLGLLLYNYYLFISEKVKINKIVQGIELIEKNPEDVSNYDRLIKIWKQSGYIQPRKFIQKGYYHRILRICEENCSNLQSWQLLKEVSTKCLVFLQETYQSETLKLLMNILSKEFNNPPIKEKIMQIVMPLIPNNQAKIQFMSHWLSTSIIILDNITPNCYIADIPVKIYNLSKYRNRTTVNIDLISFEIFDNGFTVTKNTTIYDCSQLFQIFLQAIEHHEAQILINYIPRKLLIYDDNSCKISDMKYLQTSYDKYIKIDNDLKKLDSEITKLELLIKVLERSRLDQYHNKIDIYQRHVHLLKDTSLKGTDIKNKSFQFMQECVLSIYLQDIEPHLFNVKNEKVSWDDNYESLEKEYDLFQSMMDQCNQMEHQSHAIV